MINNKLRKNYKRKCAKHSLRIIYTLVQYVYFSKYQIV